MHGAKFGTTEEELEQTFNERLINLPTRYRSIFDVDKEGGKQRQVQLLIDVDLLRTDLVIHLLPEFIKNHPEIEIEKARGLLNEGVFIAFEEIDHPTVLGRVVELPIGVILVVDHVKVIENIHQAFFEHKDIAVVLDQVWRHEAVHLLQYKLLGSESEKYTKRILQFTQAVLIMNTAFCLALTIEYQPVILPLMLSAISFLCSYSSYYYGKKFTPFEREAYQQNKTIRPDRYIPFEIHNLEEI